MTKVTFHDFGEYLKILLFSFVLVSSLSILAEPTYATAGPITINGKIISADILYVSGPDSVQYGSNFRVVVRVKNDGERPYGSSIRLQLVGIVNGENVVLDAKPLQGLENGRVGQRTLTGRFSLTGEMKYFVRVRQVTRRKNLARSSDYTITVTERLENRQLFYVHRGETRHINFAVKKSLNDYLSRLPRVATGAYELQFLDNSVQKPELQKLTVFVKRKAAKYIADNPGKVTRLNLNQNDEAARIAIAMVQRIPYHYDVYYDRVAHQRRYPYEVVYDNLGVCDEKSRLMAFLLRDLGYGVNLFHYRYNSQEGHMALGIKCQTEYSYRNSGYCFIEATRPWIVTHVSSVAYGTLSIIEISDGRSFDATRENKNKLEYEYLTSKSSLPTNEWNRYNQIKTVYGLDVDWD